MNGSNASATSRGLRVKRSDEDLKDREYCDSRKAGDVCILLIERLVEHPDGTSS
jgi:hypothetical protein